MVGMEGREWCEGEREGGKWRSEDGRYVERCAVCYALYNVYIVFSVILQYTYVNIVAMYKLKEKYGLS